MDPYQARFSIRVEVEHGAHVRSTDVEEFVVEGDRSGIEVGEDRLFEFVFVFAREDELDLLDRRA
ncbi:MAG TPA: hypothetical protein VIX83_08665 [Candidatus Cybelea sp.]